MATVTGYQNSIDRSFDRGMRGINAIIGEEMRQKQLAEQQAFAEAMRADEQAFRMKQLEAQNNFRRGLMEEELAMQQQAAIGEVMRNTQAYKMRMAEIEDVARAQVLSDPMGELTGKDSPLKTSDKKAIENGDSLSTLSREAQNLIESKVAAQVGALAMEDRVLQDLVKRGVDWASLQEETANDAGLDLDLIGGDDGESTSSEPEANRPPPRPRSDPAPSKEVARPGDFFTDPETGQLLQRRTSAAEAFAPVARAATLARDTVYEMPNVAERAARSAQDTLTGLATGVVDPEAPAWTDQARDALRSVGDAVPDRAKSAWDMASKAVSPLRHIREGAEDIGSTLAPLTVPKSTAKINPDRARESLSAFRSEKKRRQGGEPDSPHWNERYTDLDDETIDERIRALTATLYPVN